MQTQFQTDVVSPELIVELVGLAWQTFLGVDPVPFDGVALEHDLVAASIGIGGPWQATVILTCSRAAAANAAMAALGMSAEELEDADVRDILGELANVVGGNLKGVVSGDEQGWVLSLPVVSDGAQTVPGSRELVRVGFVCDGEPLVCEIREHA